VRLGAGATLEELERAFEPPQSRVEIGSLVDVEAVGLVQMVHQLERVPDVLGGSLRRPRTNDVASIEGAPSFGAAAQVYDAAAIDGDLRQDRASRHGPAVDPAATVSEQATGREHGLICHQWRAGATRTAVV